MADDIDDLLDEVEKSLGKPKEKPKAYKTSTKIDDLTDLLDDFEPPLEPVVAEKIVAPDTSTQASISNKKCYPLYLGGTSLPVGMSTGVTVRACNQLRCLECDCAVITFEGFQWSDNTDYLFLRNNYPVAARLRARLNPLRGTRAYTCQCKQRSVNAATQLPADSEMKWVCGKH
ncbi:cilia- and flagella-associated protein 418-like [Penaeus chinensis]|uniref:cilia- and flagella-associated protein 418-like n=1 Tax=Penaeus chinensis TaxID=139456 RepID=UPI001FB6E12F|nr:cilia- and flagella-associated protein 418-like [Penaeus chinensis]